MQENVLLYKTQIKCLETIACIAELSEVCKKITMSPSQEDIDKIAEIANKYNNISEELKFSIVDLLQMIIKNNEEIEITAYQNEIGYKIN